MVSMSSHQFAIQHAGSGTHQLRLCLLTFAPAGVGAYRLSGQLQRLGFNIVSINGGKQSADKLGEFHASGGVPDTPLLIGTELFVQPCQSSRQG
jgi:hypothetical protein